jgi:LacI family transcriptional regulator
MSSVISAIGARRAVQEAGLTLGHDVSLIAYDDDLSYLSNRQDVPVFTAVRSSIREAGRQCAQILVDQIARPDDLSQSALLEAELVVGSSTGPVAS